MERNRRIGKAYARVPIVTIDGSPELSYDGYKLALNGFDSPNRDAKIEDCRKRIGKGIRIKMDNFGNILIKRLSKAGVYIKEWIQVSGNQDHHNKRKLNTLNRLNNMVMPSRQQLIKNHQLQDSGIFNTIGRPTSSLQLIYSTNGSNSSSRYTQQQQQTNSSIDSTNQKNVNNSSSICEEIINIDGRLEQDKIYVIFDMKKFQQNISQELCLPFPDKRKLERQCFSIIGLVRDSIDILSLPCWVMVINIVAIEMLNERFSQQQPTNQFPDRILMDEYHHPYNNNNNLSTTSARDYTIYNNNNNSSGGVNGNQFMTTMNKLRGPVKSCMSITDKMMEDPYTLPANASLTEINKSSGTDDYGTTTLGRNKLDTLSRQQQQQQQSSYYGSNSILSEGTTNNLLFRNSINRSSIADGTGSGAKMRSKSSCNLVRGQQQTRYNRKSIGGCSIYSPGHMLLQNNTSSSTTIPPKLPPRDFNVSNKKTISTMSASKSTSQINTSAAAAGIEEPPIDYNSNNDQDNDDNDADVVDDNNDLVKKAHKTRRSKFLESLKQGTALALATTTTLDERQTKSSQKSSSSELANNNNNNTSVSKSISSNSSTGDSLMMNSTKTTSSSGSGIGSNNNSRDSQINDGSGITKPTSKTGSKVKGLKLLLTGGSNSGSSKSGSGSNITTGSKKSTTKDDGVGSGSGDEDSSGYVHVDNNSKQLEPDTNYDDEDEVDSVVDSTELLILDDEDCRHNSSNNNGWQDECCAGLDIPTPDYEIDENIYAFGQEVTGRNSQKQQPAAATAASYRCFTALSASKNENGRRQHPGIATTAAATLNGRKSAARSSMNYYNYTNANTNKDDLYHTGFRKSHVQQQQQQQQQQLGDLSMGTSSRSARSKEKMLMAGSQDGYTASYVKGDLYNTNSRMVPTTNNRMVSNQYGSSTIGSRYRSASMQRYQSRNALPQNRYQSDTIYNLDSSQCLEGQDISSYYGTSRKPNAKSAGNYSSTLIRNNNHGNQYGIGAAAAVPAVAASNIINSTYTIGRSSSGIYNSSSSSSDYVDWNPQMRKFNSSGYLNSIFKSHNPFQLAKQNSIRTTTTTTTNPQNTTNKNSNTSQFVNNETTATTTTNGSKNAATLPHDGYANSMSRQSRSKPTTRNRLTNSSTLTRNANQYEHPVINRQLTSNTNKTTSEYRSFEAPKDDLGRSYILPSRWLMA